MIKIRHYYIQEEFEGKDMLYLVIEIRIFGLLLMEKIIEIIPEGEPNEYARHDN